MKLVFSEKSLEDLENILTFIARDKPIAAARFVNLIEQHCQLLVTCPGAGTPRDDWVPACVCSRFVVMEFTFDMRKLNFESNAYYMAR